MIRNRLSVEVDDVGVARPATDDELAALLREPGNLTTGDELDVSAFLDSPRQFGGTVPNIAALLSSYRTSCVRRGESLPIDDGVAGVDISDSAHQLELEEIATGDGDLCLSPDVAAIAEEVDREIAGL